MEVYVLVKVIFVLLDIVLLGALYNCMEVYVLVKVIFVLLDIVLLGALYNWMEVYDPIKAILVSGSVFVFSTLCLRVNFFLWCKKNEKSFGG